VGPECPRILWDRRRGESGAPGTWTIPGAPPCSGSGGAVGRQLSDDRATGLIQGNGKVTDRIHRVTVRTLPVEAR
jgi:hypothetical protein